MIELWFRLLCDECEDPYDWLACKADENSSHPADKHMLAAEIDGWKVNRLARNAYYGKALCPKCRPDKCKRCFGRKIVPDFKQWDSYHGEPAPVPCPNCQGKGVEVDE